MERTTEIDGNAFEWVCREVEVLERWLSKSYFGSLTVLTSSNIVGNVDEELRPEKGL
jgi:hypothetical protein